MAAFVVARRFRGNLQQERIFHARTNPLEIYDDGELHAKFRFRRMHILSIVDEVQDAIEYAVTCQGSLSVLLQVSIALRFFATGCFHNLAGKMIGVDKSTASRAIHAMVALMHRWVFMPTQHQADLQKVKCMRIAGFPNVIGCIDGTHIRIQGPSTNEHEYVNRKNVHMINVQVISILLYCILFDSVNFHSPK